MSFAVSFRQANTSACTADGLACRSKATTPAKIGVAADVPESLAKYPEK